MSAQPIDISLSKIKFLYRIAGLNLENEKMSWKQKCLFAFNVSWMDTDVFFAILWFFKGITGTNKSTFIDITYVTLCSTQGLMAHFKTFSIIYYGKCVRQLLSNIRDLERTKLFNNPAGHALATKETKTLGNVIKLITCLNVLMLLMFNLRPFVLSANKYFKTGEVMLTLPFLNLYPFNAYDIHYWPFAYVHELWTVTTASVQIFAVDFLFYVCCTHIKIQFMLLQEAMENIIPDTGIVAQTQSQRQKMAKEHREKLSDVLRWHQVILKSAEMLEKIFTKATFYNYMASSLIICLTSFNIVSNNDRSIAVPFFAVFFVRISQIFYLCYYGDTVTSASVNVSTAAYNCRWYLADVSIGKTMNFALTRSQTPCRLTAGGFVEVNLTTFMKILSTAWSYFALLQTLYA